MGACASLPQAKESPSGSSLKTKPTQGLAKIESTKGKPSPDAQKSALTGEQVTTKLESARTGDSADSFQIRAEGEENNFLDELAVWSG